MIKQARADEPKRNVKKPKKNKKVALIAADIDKWCALHKILHVQIDCLQALTGASPDCALLGPVYALWSAHTDLLSKQIGDKSGWLEWYEFECSMGAKPKEVTFLDANKKTINMVVKTTYQLAMVIAI